MSFTIQAIGNAKVPYSYTKLVTDGLILGYQKLISPINQSSCSMYPTCSEYAKEAFRKNNLLIAWLKTSDRLIRCSNDPNKYSIIDINGMLRFKDPVNYEKIKYSLSNDKGYIPLFKGSKHSSKEEININADLLYEFANQLKYNGELDEAIIEYKRLISYYPNSIYRINSLISIFNIYYQQDKYIEAIKLGKKLINENNTDIKADVNFFIGTSYLKIKNYNLARQYLRTTREYGFKEISEKTHLVEGLSYILEEKWSLAIKCFGEIKEDSNFYDKAQEFIYLSKQGTQLKLRSPEVAGLLSVIPGLGYYYNGYKQTALSSFFVNSLFIWAANQSFSNGNDGLGTLIGVFGIGFYSGNIYGSIMSAKETNRQIIQNHILKFKLGFKY